MSSYYDAFGGSSGPPDPFEDEEPPAEGDEEPDYSTWADDQDSDRNIITGEVDALHADYSYLERKARREDGPEYDFWKGMNK